MNAIEETVFWICLGVCIVAIVDKLLDSEAAFACAITFYISCAISLYQRIKG